MLNRTVKIVQRPFGEAPEWVRDAWIGLSLPLIDPDPVETEATGVLTGPRTRIGLIVARLLGRLFRARGYLVDAPGAIAILAERNPDAADWWRVHAPHFLRPGEAFLFDEPACGAVEFAPVNDVR